MKLTPDELLNLLHPPLEHAQRLPARDASEQAGAPGLTVEFLRVCSKSLWQKVDSNHLTKKETRQRVLALLEWLAKKQGWDFKSNSTQPYLHDHQKIDGRVHAQISSQETTVVVEICFELQDAIIAKLWAATLQQKQVLILWGGSPMGDAALSAKISGHFGGRPVPWLRFLQLKKPS
jgi:hypothetical protein